MKLSEIVRVTGRTAYVYPDLGVTEKQKRRFDLMLEHIASRPHGALMRLEELGAAMHVLGKNANSRDAITSSIVSLAVKKGVVYRHALPHTNGGFTLIAATPVKTTRLEPSKSEKFDTDTKEFVYDTGRYFNRTWRKDTRLLSFLETQRSPWRVNMSQLSEIMKTNQSGLYSYLQWTAGRGLIEFDGRYVTALIRASQIANAGKKEEYEAIPLPSDEYDAPVRLRILKRDRKFMAFLANRPSPWRYNTYELKQIDDITDKGFVQYVADAERRGLITATRKSGGRIAHIWANFTPELQPITKETTPMETPVTTSTNQVPQQWPDQVPQEPTQPSWTIEQLQQQAMAYAWQHPEASPHLREFMNFVQGD